MDIKLSVFTGIMIYAIYHDIRTYLIPNCVPVILLIFGLLVNSINILGAVICSAPLLLANIMSDDNMGMGDVKLIFALGFVLGVFKGLFIIITSFTIALIVNYILVFAHKREKHKPIALAPYICSVALIAYIL